VKLRRIRQSGRRYRSPSRSDVRAVFRVRRSHDAARMLDNPADAAVGNRPNVASDHAHHGMTMRIVDARYSARECGIAPQGPGPLPCAGVARASNIRVIDVTQVEIGTAVVTAKALAILRKAWRPVVTVGPAGPMTPGRSMLACSRLRPDAGPGGPASGRARSAAPG
jgi:hypothetical protein